MLPIVGLRYFLSGYETAISPQKYISKSHWPHKFIFHMRSQCSIIIWVTTLVTNACCLKGHRYKEHHKCLWSWKSSLHSQPLLTFLHSLQWPLDYGGTQHLGSQHLRTQHFRNSPHFRNQWTKMDGNEQIEFRWPYILLWTRIPQKKCSPHSQQKSPKWSTWVQSQKRQNALGWFPRQTTQHHSNPSHCPNH